MSKRRLVWLGLLMLVGLGGLTARLVQIQLVETASFSRHDVNLIEASVKQRTQSVTLDDGRGKFYDRYGTGLNHEEVPALVLFPFLDTMVWPSAKIASLIGVPEAELKRAVADAKEPFALTDKDGRPIVLTSSQTKSVNDLRVPGVFAVREQFYSQKPLAAQLIGTTVEYSSLKQKRYPERELSAETRIGYNGLQKAFDEFLLTDGESKLVYHVDAKSGPLFGVDVRYTEPANPLYPVKIITTLDKTLQEQAEKLVDEHGIKKGGLVLIDIEKSEVTAMVSRPAFNSSDPAGEGSANNMLRQQTPGSVFKTVTAAAAIDYKLDSPQQVFNCNLAIDDTKKAQRLLGNLSFEESFAQSCNRTFGETAASLMGKSPDFLADYAEKLGLIGGAGWKGEVYHSPLVQFYQEETGRVWDKNAEAEQKKDKRMTEKAAIGQQDVQVSPLALANMMASIARGGEKKMVKTVNRVEFNNGTSVYKFPDKDMPGNTISPYTAMKLQELLRSVVTSTNGTGHALADLPYAAAGKSGTAQTDTKNKKMNKWFAGYFPYDQPKYALVTVSLDTTEDTESMVPLFGDLVQKIYEKEHSSEKTAP